MQMTREAFTAKYYPFIKNVVKGTGIFPEILIAQAIIESQGNVNGKFYVGASKLASQYNNYFGIKASSKWKGPSVKLKTGEIINDRAVTITDAFRVYTSIEDSIRDYVKFLKENPRYSTAGVFEAENYKEQADRLHAAGYATGRDYAVVIAQIAGRVKDYIRDIEKNNGLETNWPLILAGVALFFLIKK